MPAPKKNEPMQEPAGAPYRDPALSKAERDERIAEIVRIKAAKGWRPEPGDEIKGTVVKILPRKTLLEGKEVVYPVLIIDTKEADGPYTAVHAFHSLLLQSLYEYKVSPNDDIVIVYHGQQESKKLNAKGEPRMYHAYTVVVNGEDTQTDWSWDNAEPENVPF